MPDNDPIPPDSQPSEPAEAAEIFESPESPQEHEPPQPTKTEKEPAPMLDIHDAHHAASTWREFFIHIATIVLGLIIAVSLETTVEYIHHQHERRQLEEDLRAEAEGRSLSSRRIPSNLPPIRTGSARGYSADVPPLPPAGS